MQTKENAIQMFRSGYNCSQAVLTAYSEKLNFDKTLASMITCGFGAGMGRMQETCGAVTGAFMVLGIYHCQKYTDNNDRKESTYSSIQQFSHRFKALHGSTNCAKLIQCDLKSLEGRTLAKERKLFDTICEKCVADAVNILEELIN